MDSEQEQSNEPAPQETSEIVPDTGAWAVASKLVARVKRPPSNFVVTVRTLLKEPQAKAGNLSSESNFEVGRLLRSSSVLACYYFASKSYRGELFMAKPSVGSSDFAKSYSSLEHAALLSLIVYNRSFAKKSNKEEWAYIEAPLFEALDLGALVSRTVDSIDLGVALLCRGMRYLAFAPFLWESENDFKEYRRYLKKEDLAFDLDYEMKVWGCTNMHIASILLSLVGFSREASMALYLSNEAPLVNGGDTYFRNQFFICESILQSITEGNEIPKQILDGFTVSEANRHALETQSKILSDNPSQIEWLNKGKSNVNAESTPELFAAKQPTA